MGVSLPCGALGAAPMMTWVIRKSGSKHSSDNDESFRSPSGTPFGAPFRTTTPQATLAIETDVLGVKPRIKRVGRAVRVHNKTG